MTDKDRLDAIVEAEILAFRQRCSFIGFRTAVDLMMTDYDTEEVIHMLRQTANEIEEFG